MKMNKTIVMSFLASLFLPLISAIDNPMGLDLYYLFVENIFGSFLFSIIGFSAFFVLLGMFSRMSITLMSFMIGLFIMVNLMGLIGMGFIFIVFVFAGIYLGSAIVKLFSQMF